MVKQRILTVDIGNTSTFFAEISNGKIGRSLRTGTKRTHASNVARDLKKRFDLKRIDAIVIASVVPSLGRSLRQTLPRALGVKTLLIGKDLQVPIVNKYRYPKQVGIDRLVNAYAAYQTHRGPAVIIDFGTAITFDAISAKGEYLGGVIAPGIEISLEALFERTALLPKTTLRHVLTTVIGRDTVESIRIGCSTGIGGLCDRMTDRIRRKLGRKTIVIATGGYASFMKRYCRSIHRVAPGLTIQGIWLTYKNHSKKNT